MSSAMSTPRSDLFACNYGRRVDQHDVTVIKHLVMERLFFKSIADQIVAVEDAFVYTLRALARASEAYDEDTGNHIVRVGEYAAALAEQLQVPEKFVQGHQNSSPGARYRQGPYPPGYPPETGSAFRS